MRRLLSLQGALGLVLVLLGAWMALAASWGVGIEGRITWMWWASMSFSLVVIALGGMVILREVMKRSKV
jgi:hypothetical protein